jgi:hypothetical protein
MKPESEPQGTPKLYDLERASVALGSVSVWTLRKHVSRRTVRVTRIGRRVFLPSEEIERIQREGLPSLGVQGKAGHE